MKRFILIPIAAAVLTVGCASSNEYKMYADTQKSVAEARAKAEIARYQALADIAKTGDAAARVAAVISINQSTPQQREAMVAQPTSGGDTALKWASVIFPSLTQIYGINRNTEVAIVNSSNSLEGKKADNDMIVDLVKDRADPIIGNKTSPDGSTEEYLLYPN
jgi:hypothetical protein